MRSDGTERRVAGETSLAESENPGLAPCCTQAGTTDELPSLSLRHLSDQGGVPQRGSSGRTAFGLRKGLLLRQMPRTPRDAMSEEADVGPRERVRRWVGYGADSAGQPHLQSLGRSYSSPDAGLRGELQQAPTGEGVPTCRGGWQARAPAGGTGT